jgi:UDP-4-amino-4-deoxy-L-arabinose formyltransferase/UDP-glucuronic acid dehydrogenase (UDP-4-keto-hexauronic acid decarboxylating)
MRIAIIGRSETLYNIALSLLEKDHEIVFILTAKEAPEYLRNTEDFRKLADKYRIPFEQGSQIVEYADFLRNAHADIGVSMNYPGILPQSVIDLFPLGVLNVHGGDLPRYRGNACQAWAIINGEESIGLCVHKMIGGELDSGDILARDYINIDHNTKVTQVLEWIAVCAPKLIHEALQKLKGNPDYVLEKQSKNLNDTLRCYPRKPEDGRIDWSQPAIDVIRLINASNKPYAGAFCEFEGEKLIIWDAELLDDGEVFCAVPGQVTRIGDGFIEVACKDAKIVISTCEKNGAVCNISTFIRSIRKRLN